MSEFSADGARPDAAINELIHYSYIGTDRVMTQPDPLPPPRYGPFTPSAFTGGGGTTRHGFTRVGFEMQFDPTDVSAATVCQSSHAAV